MSRNKLLSFILIAIIYLMTAGASYMFFSNNISASQEIAVVPSSAGTSGQAVFNENLPKTEPCPLNGALYSKQQREWWEKNRPIGAMIENHQEARPQSGLDRKSTRLNSSHMSI